MDTITLYKNREQIIRSILDADEDTISKIADILKKAVRYPARMTVEELKSEAMQSVEDAKNGKGISHEEFFKEAEKW